METKKNNSEYIPEFDKSFRHPALLGSMAGRSSDGGYRFNAAKVP